jgi:hypothetical protein
MVPPLQGQAVEQEKATLACFTPEDEGSRLFETSITLY